jgi:predicted O-methyltransferase YrrM
MKQQIKKILPKKILLAAQGARDGMQLCGVPRMIFSPDSLKAERDISLPVIFADSSLAAQWKRAHEEISAVYGDKGTYGGINPGDRQALYYLLSALKPQKVLEVGTHIGASTLYIARALKEVSPQARVTTVDILDVNAPDAPWKQLNLEMSPAAYAAKLGVRDHIDFQVSPAVPYMEKTNEKFDFIFLDGDHSSQAVYKEVSAALKLLNPGGLILLHDFYPGAKPLFPNGNIIFGPFRALDRISRENPAIAATPLGELPWPTKEGVKVTSLALVTRRA